MNFVTHYIGAEFCTTFSRKAGRFKWLMALAILAFLLPFSAQAQVPSLAIAGLPSTPLIGEETCFTLEFQNLDSNTGYGPYVFITLPPGLTITSNSFINVPPLVQNVGTVDQTGMIADPISGEMVSGTPGAIASIVRYPVGSVVQGQVPLVLNVCDVVEPGAEIGVPLDIEFLPGFEFGDTATGDNGPIVAGAATPSTVTPQLARVEKINNAPEGERPPGASHPFTYSYNVNISEGATLHDFHLVDDLPNDLQWTGGLITVNAQQGTLCQTNTSPDAPPVSGGSLTVHCATLTGTSSNSDLMVTLPVYITDVLDQSNSNTKTILNTVNIDFDYDGTAYNESDDSQVTAKHVATQKTAEPATVSLADTITYTVDFQVTDYSDTGSESLTALVLTDVLSDGLFFIDNSTLSINGANIAIAPTVVPGPGTGQSTVTFDITQANGDPVPLGSDGQLTYQVEVKQSYIDGIDIVASDSLSNAIQLDYLHSEGADGSDMSNANVVIVPNNTVKTLVAPSPAPASFAPGDQITFRVQLDVPSENTKSISFTDFLPLPVTYVADIDPNTDITVPGLPGITSVAPVYSQDIASNSFTLTWPDPAGLGSSVIAADVTVTITTKPFADDLFLTNLLQTSTTNNAGEPSVELVAKDFRVGAPKLVLTKGVLNVSNPAATISPPAPADPTQALANSNASGLDAGDQITYVITIENVGSQAAWNLNVTDPAVDGLSCDPLAVGDVTNGSGQNVTFVGNNLQAATGIIIAGPVAGNDANPPGGGAPFADDTVLIRQTCTIASTAIAGETIINTASVAYTSANASNNNFPASSDDAVVRISVPVIKKSIQSVTPGYAGNNQRAHIGEIVDYRVTIEIPEGVSPDVYFEDLLDPGLAFVELTSITASDALSTSIGSFNGVMNNAIFTNQGIGDSNLDRLLRIGPASNSFGFGTITNTDTDNNQTETITLDYRVRVLNTTANIRGADRNNRARWSWAISSGRQQVQVSAPNVTIIEPGIQVSKAFIPATVDQGTPSVVQIRVQHTSNSNATAYQLNLNDVFPAGIQLDPGSLQEISCNNSPDNYQNSAAQMQAAWPTFPLGSDCTIQFDVLQSPPLPAGSLVTNCAHADWTSMDDIDLPLPAPPSNPLGVQRTGDNNDAGGAANTYTNSACANLKIFNVGINKAVSSSTQINTIQQGGVEDLAIGEEVTFLLTATMPESPVTNLVIEDSLPIAGLVLEALSARVLPLPNDTNLTIPGGLPTAVLEDLSGDGINDTVSITFGSPILNTPDSIIDHKDRIEVEVTARVRNLPINQNLAEDKNVGRVRFGEGLQGASEAPVRLVEPLLSITKSGDITNVEAGNEINYTLTVKQLSESRSDAFDVSLEDTLPPELSVVASSVTVGSCDTQPDAAPTASGNTITANWASFPLGVSCEILFTATVEQSAVAGSIIKNKTNLGWKSLDGTEPTDVDERSYTDQSSWEVRVGDPAINKTLIDSDITETDGQHLTIGETATFEIVVDFPDGTTENVSVTDLLPTQDGALELISATITAIGSELTLPGGAAVGDNGDDCLPDCGTPTLGYDALAAWNLGDVINAPDTGGPITGPPEQIVFEVVAIVKNLPLNQGIPVGPDTIYNITELASENLQASDQAPITLVEPRLALKHTLKNGQSLAEVSAGETVNVKLTISHLPTSSAPAFNLSVEDTLNDQVNWVDINTVNSTCTGVTTDISNLPVVRFEFDQLPTAQSSCEITFDVQMSPTLPIPGVYEDTSTLDWESAPGSVESRPGQDTGSAEYISPADGALSKRLVNTSVLLTNRNQGDPLLEDLTIGETVTYELVAGLAEGTSNAVTLSDTLPDSLEIISASVSSVGANITTSTAIKTITGQTVSFDFGTVVNLADGISDKDDLFGVSITARVLDIPQNQNGIVLSNSAVLQFGNEERTAVEAVELVAPELALSKAFGSLVNKRVDITLTVTNTGTAPAFSTAITDVFDESLWVAGSVQEVSVPNGWKLDVQSASGQTTVTFEPDGSPIQPQPDQILVPGGSRTVAFSMELIMPATVPTVDNTANASADSLRNSDPNGRTVTAQGTANLPLPILNATKVWSGPNNPAVPGDTLTYSIEVINSGDGDATMVVINDAPDPLGEFQAGSVVAADGTVLVGNFPTDTSISVEFATIAAQQSAVFTYQVRVPDPYPAGVAKQFVNQAIVSSNELDDFLSDDPGTDPEDDPTIAPVVAEPIMSIIKDDVSDVVGAGGTIFYKLDYANTGNQDATGVFITESVPANTVFNQSSSSTGWSCPDQSPAGTTCTYTVGDLRGSEGDTIYFAVTVDDPVGADVTQINNTAYIADDDDHTDDDSDGTPIVAAPVLDITKDDGGITTTPGGTVVYQLDYVNNGTRNATGVHLLESVPAHVVFDAAASLPDVWSCPDGSPTLTSCDLHIGDLEGAGLGTGQARFAVRVNSPLPAGVDLIENLVIIADDGNATDGQPVVAQAFDDTPIIAAPDLVIVKDDGGIIGQAGEIITYTLSYQQVGNQDATGVRITETVPVGSTYAADSSLPDVWSCADESPAGTQCVLQIGNLPAGSSGTVNFGLRVADPLPAGQSEIINTAVIADDGTNGPDPTPENNTDTVATLVTLFPPAGKKLATEVGIGNVQWSMVWFNNQNTTDLPVSIYDPIPAHSNYRQNSLTCTATGTSQCLSAVYNASENRIEVEAIISPDFGKPDSTPESQLDNEIVVTFETLVASTTPLYNEANACWDENNSGSADDDRAMGQTCVVVSADIVLSVAIPLLSTAGTIVLVLLMMLGGGIWHLRQPRRFTRPE